MTRSAKTRTHNSADRAATSAPRQSLYANKRPIIRFLLLFGLYMAVFYVITAIPLYRQRLFPAYLNLNAQVSGTLLRWLGEEIVVSSTSVSSPRWSLEIMRGCDAIEPTVIFIAAVLAFPAGLVGAAAAGGESGGVGGRRKWWRRKWLVALLGGACLLLLNLVRIISLYYTGVFWTSAFETMHVDVWQPLFILAAVMLWIMWAWRVTGRVVQPN